MNLNQVEESRWLTGGLIAFAAVLTLIALGGAWWAVTDPGVVPSGDLHVLPTRAPEASGPVLAAASAVTGNAPPGAAAIEPAAAQGVPDTIRAVPIPPAPPVAVAGNASAGTLPASLGATQAAPLMLPLASGVDASAQAATPMPAAPAQAPAPDLMQVLQPVDAAPATTQAPDTTQTAAAPKPAAASAPSLAGQVAACDKYAWYQVLQRQQCLWSVCNGRWGRDGCPAYQHHSSGEH